MQYSTYLRISAQRAAWTIAVLRLCRCISDPTSCSLPQQASPLTAAWGAGPIDEEMMKDARKRIASTSAEPFFSAGGSGGRKDSKQRKQGPPPAQSAAAAAGAEFEDADSEDDTALEMCKGYLNVS